MRKLFLLLPLMVILAGCTNGVGNNDKDRSQQPDSAYYHQTCGKAECTVNLMLPAEKMNLPVGEWIDEMLGGIYPGDQTDMQGLADYYGQYLLDTLYADSREIGDDVEMSYEVTTKKLYETDLFVTYTMAIYADLGGAHPSTLIKGATFRKRDGRRLGWDIISSQKSEAISELLKGQLKDYFEVETDNGLNEQLTLESPYQLPLPQNPPYFTENGMAFVYQQYEIAAYAAGLPSGTIGYEQAKPLMTSWAQRLLK